MENQKKQAEQLLKEAQEWFGQITKAQIHGMDSISVLHPNLAFVLKVFYAMVNNQPLDKDKELLRTLDPSKPQEFDHKLFFKKVQRLFSPLNPKPVKGVVDKFDPLKLSEQTVLYVNKIKAETLECPEPEVTEEKIKMTSIFGYKIWKWCKCMLQITSFPEQS